MIYEVVWFRELSLVIGTTVYAFSAMLTSFLAGLSLGSYVMSRRADSHGNVIRLFALLELGIGLFGLVSLPLFKAISFPYAFLFSLFQSNTYAIALSQFIMSFFVMIVPTTMLGALFPLISKAYASDFNRLGGSIGSLYGANSWGCVLGAYASGFILMPLIGVSATCYLAAGLNLSVGAVILFLSGRSHE
jgi:spermidine synthase